MVPWLTRSADNGRSGWNSQETQLTQASVASRGIARVTIIPLVGDARGMEAQPLILPGVLTQRGTRDVLVLPSMANVVRGVDAHDGSSIWQTTLGTPVTGSKAIDMWQINQFWGCISTGVIDPDLKRLYQVCWVLPNAQGTPLPAGAPSTNPNIARYFMFVLNMGDGSLATEPVLISGTSNGQSFVNPKFPRKQRSSLVETNINGVKTVFGCSGTIQETSAGAAGYCFAFDVASNTMAAMLAMTEGEGAGVWMGGQGAAADPNGDLYVTTGNGDFDGVRQFGESFLKIRYTPASAGNAASLKVVDHWTPWTDLARSGGVAPPKNKVAGVSAPSDAMSMPVGGGMNMNLRNAKVVGEIANDGKLTVRVVPQAMAQGQWADEDWGSAGPACIFSLGLCVATGKDGIGYPIKTANMGGTKPADLRNPATNCAKLAAPPVWLTVDPGPVSPCPPNPMTLNFFPWGDTAHMHMTPVQFFDPLLNSWTIFAWGENNQLHKWKVSSTGTLTYLAQGNEFASANVRGASPGGMTGGFCSGSSNGSDLNSAILACTIPYMNANQVVGNGRLLIYDPVHLAANGTLQVLWDSQAHGVQFLFNKFDPPVIDGGHIYVPNYNGGVDLYTLTPAP
ncbi:hypothetical protein [Granulicella sp. dw_53]|uniref:hypothetical protein n=1 Tax=Granulicella sp. dw_53 TaxID=2719792 RepID=UPI001BD6CF64|nr:hypothetical protein [Granulicella sp. dw_53]